MIELNFGYLESCPNSFSNALKIATTRKASESRVVDPFPAVKIQLLPPPLSTHSETDVASIDPCGFLESSIIRA